MMKRAKESNDIRALLVLRPVALAYRKSRTAASWQSSQNRDCPVLADSRPTAVAGYRPGGIDPLRSVLTGSFAAAKNSMRPNRTLRAQDFYCNSQAVRRQ
jgi:hypothetical protein